jgi:hypothetical protein
MPPGKKDDGTNVRVSLEQDRATEAGGPGVGSGRARRVGAELLGCWTALMGACLLLYWPGLRAGYFSDDLLFFFYAPPRHLYDYFAFRGAAAQAYRPLEAIILTLIQQHYRFETLPIHLISFGAHAGLCCGVLAAGRRLGLGQIQRWTACAFMLVAQVSAPAVLGNDTMSQSVSAFLGGLSALFLYLAWVDRGRDRPRAVSIRWWTLSVAAYTTSIFFKETALGFLLVAFLLIAVIALEHQAWAVRVRTAVTLSFPYCAASAVYLAARLHAGGAVSQSGSYRIHIGANIVRNLAEFALGAFGPVSTVDGAVAVAMHRTPLLLLEGLGCLLIVALLLAGIVVSGRAALSVWLLAAAAASLFPAYLLMHVSELYLYNAIPFLSLVLGIAFGALWYRSARARTAAAAGMVLLIGGQIYADWQKAELMSLNGRRAARIYAGIERYLPSLPPKTTVLLVNRTYRTPEYSVFLLNGFDVVDLGNLRIGPILGRPDVRVELIDDSQAQNLRDQNDRMLLALDATGGVLPYHSAEQR